MSERGRRTKSERMLRIFLNVLLFGLIIWSGFFYWPGQVHKAQHEGSVDAARYIFKGLIARSCEGHGQCLEASEGSHQTIVIRCTDGSRHVIAY